MKNTASENYRLETCTSYSLRKLFQGVNDKICIPDLQRDYCWGKSNTNNDRVGPFIDSLLELKKDTDITLGIIYGYFDKIMPDHLQLCDGQQRITTLFLLIGVLNRKLSYQFTDILISEFERERDDYEPYLKYAIRESSLYFISDLVKYYFSKPETDEDYLQNVESIKNSNWFLNSYLQAPTIKSMLIGIYTIEKKLDGMQPDALQEFADFIIGKDEDKPHLSLLFFDMENRTNGEETFVVINTTGEPLSANQNLKPLMINKYGDDVADKWEKMEAWFWNHRNKAEQKHTADEGMTEFFRCVRLIQAQSVKEYLDIYQSHEKFPYEKISFDSVYKLFEAYSRIYTLDYSERFDKPIAYETGFTAADLYRLLPTLKYCSSFNPKDDETLKRVYHMFSVISKYRSVDNAYTEGRQAAPAYQAMQLVQELFNKINIADNSEKLMAQDILCLRENNNEYFEHEKAKLDLTYNAILAGRNRKEVELLIAKAEQNKIFNGRLKYIIDWSIKETNSENLGKITVLDSVCDEVGRFKAYMDKIEELWNLGSSKQMDILRCALLTCNWKEYPIEQCSLGANPDQWFRFFERNNLQIKKFIEEGLTLEERINDYSATNNKFYCIIKNSNLLAMSKSKNIRCFKNDIVFLMEKERTTANYLVFLHNVIFEKMCFGGHWEPIREWEGVLYSDHKHYNVCIDIRVIENGYLLTLWSGKHPDRHVFEQICEVASELNFVKKENSNSHFDYIVPTAENARELAKAVAAKIDSLINA